MFDKDLYEDAFTYAMDDAMSNYSKGFNLKSKKVANSKNYNNKGGSGNSNYRASKPVKHSGAKLSRYVPTSGKNKNQNQYLVTAWKLAGKDLIAIKAITTHNSKDSGKGWVGSVAVTLTNVRTGVKSLYWGTMQIVTGKVVINDLGWVLNPKAPNGGYAGSFSKR